MPGVKCNSDTPSLPAAINDLLEVMISLEDFVDWMRLGLALGLHYTTLKAIEYDHPNQIGKCKMELLAAWLQQCDIVPQVGVPSWSVLQGALRRIGEEELADRIMVSCESMYIIGMVCAIKGLSFSYRRRRRLAPYLSNRRGSMTPTEPSVSQLLHV